MTKKNIYAAMLSYFETMNAAEVFATCADGDVTVGDVVQVVTKELEVLNRKNKPDSKTTAIADDDAEKVYTFLAAQGGPVDVATIMAAPLDLAGSTSNQRISNLLTRLGNRIERTKDKGKSYYTVAATSAAE